MTLESDWDRVVRLAAEREPARIPAARSARHGDANPAVTTTPNVTVARHRARAELEACLHSLRELEAEAGPPRRAEMEALARRVQAAEAAHEAAVLTEVLLLVVALDDAQRRATLAGMAEEAVERERAGRAALATRMAAHLGMARSARDRRAVQAATEAALRVLTSEVQALRGAEGFIAATRSR